MADDKKGGIRHTCYIGHFSRSQFVYQPDKSEEIAAVIIVRKSKQGVMSGFVKAISLRRFAAVFDFVI